ncbi:hypothetical protein PIB30_109057, partial [Stylosanthes scabra]|nr:hypothetical protein [Stylosanthes scabra]
ECKYLCEIEANDLLKKEVNDSEEHHSHLDKMLDKKVLFKVNVKSNNIHEADHVYTVMKICDDEDLINKHQPIDFETNSGAAPHDAGASNSVDVSGPVVNLESDADTQPTTGCGKDSVTSLKEKTPAKRPTSSQKSWSHSGEKRDKGKLSTNRFSKKALTKGAKRARVIFDDTSD